MSYFFSVIPFSHFFTHSSCLDLILLGSCRKPFSYTSACDFLHSSSIIYFIANIAFLSLIIISVMLSRKWAVISVITFSIESIFLKHLRTIASIHYRHVILSFYTLRPRNINTLSGLPKSNDTCTSLRVLL